MTQQQVVAVMGRGALDPAEPVVGADDLGLTRGDGCFDATRIEWDGEGWLAHDLDEHLERLRASATALGIDAPSDDDWFELVGDALERWTGGEVGLKMVLTRGEEHRGHRPLAFLTLTEIDEHTLRQREGISVVTLSRGYASDAFDGAPWLLGGVKTLSYAVNAAARREATRRGADDALFVSSDGYVLEGPTSAVVWLKDGTLTTTPVGATGILDSISRRAIWAADVPWTLEERLAPVSDLLAADGVWFVSSVRGLAPLVELDGQALTSDVEATSALRVAMG
ncbi:aminodeoxychorismate lyase [Mobilicoccus pelagius]|uniref:Putative aminotransferase n=1 Tax=Mobilicoccus pelagius NBRC 104925 TaxID=1089455 RepID=H5UU72_9MICO|nr:aminodeoxychorismate lyase [Mobilicoccus pelagius]GAB49280.1 putative aminotransferase [Mobilicoccus pelagius NBRC 104925]